MKTTRLTIKMPTDSYLDILGTSEKKERAKHVVESLLLIRGQRNLIPSLSPRLGKRWGAEAELRISL